MINGVLLNDPNWLTTQWTYDDFGRPLRETRPDLPLVERVCSRGDQMLEIEIPYPLITQPSLF